MDWLRKQIAILEREIAGDPIFDSKERPTQSHLDELRTKVVLHTYLRQQLLRSRKFMRPAMNLDTQEIALPLSCAAH